MDDNLLNVDFLNLVGDVSSDSSDSDSDSDSENDAEIIAVLMFMMMMDIFITCNESFQAIELSRENQRTVNHAVGVPPVIRSMAAIPQHFKDLTNFWLGEFLELCALVCPTIHGNARSTGVSQVVSGRPPKLTPEQRLLNFILYMKHDNSCYVESLRWNWSRSSICDDSIFVASCVNEALAAEIRWPGEDERAQLGRTIEMLPGCIGFVDGTLCRVRRPFENRLHSKWFQGRKKMYCLNSTVLVDHNGLFIHIDPGYPGSYHDSVILKRFMVERFWINSNHDSNPITKKRGNTNSTRNAWEHRFQYQAGIHSFRPSSRFNKYSRVKVAVQCTTKCGCSQITVIQ